MLLNLPCRLLTLFCFCFIPVLCIPFHFFPPYPSLFPLIPLSSQILLCWLFYHSLFRYLFISLYLFMLGPLLSIYFTYVPRPNDGIWWGWGWRCCWHLACDWLLWFPFTLVTSFASVHEFSGGLSRRPPSTVSPIKWIIKNKVQSHFVLILRL